MTFRAGKKHNAEGEGGGGGGAGNRSSKNVLRLASRLQHFLNTGKASKQDLKAVDNQFFTLLRQHGDQVLKLLDQLRDLFPKGRGRDAIESSCRNWATWLSELDDVANKRKKNRNSLGYSSVKVNSPSSSSSPQIEGGGETQVALLEAVIDADADLFRAILAFNSTLTSLLRKPPQSLGSSDSKEVLESAGEIFEAYESRQKILSKITGTGERVSIRGAL